MTDTIADFFWSNIDQRADRTALLNKQQGAFRPYNWRWFADRVKRLAGILQTLEVSRGDRVVQVSENRVEWLITDLAIHSVGAVHVPVHSTLSGPQIAYQIEHSQAGVVLISGAEQIAKLNALTTKLRQFAAISY